MRGFVHTQFSAQAAWTAAEVQQHGFQQNLFQPNLFQPMVPFGMQPMGGPMSQQPPGISRIASHCIA